MIRKKKVKAGRIPLNEEPIDGAEAVLNYDRYAALFMGPEYRLMARRILRGGTTSGRLLDIGAGSGRLSFELAPIRTLPAVIALRKR